MKESQHTPPNCLATPHLRSPSSLFGAGERAALVVGSLLALVIGCSEPLDPHVSEDSLTRFGPAARVLETRISSGLDDAEEYIPAGTVNQTSTDLEMIHDADPNAGYGDQVVGLRFLRVRVPRGASISRAYVQFQVDEKSTGAASLTIHGEDTSNPEEFKPVSRNLTRRTRTSASVSWSPPEWRTVGAAGADQQTSDLSSIVQEIVDRQDWSNGNALALFISGSGRRTAESFNGVKSAAPLLHIEYELPAMGVEIGIANQWDDAEEATDGRIVHDSTDLEMVLDTFQSRGDQMVGLRFQVPVPKGATVVEAHIQFTVDERDFTETSLTLRGEAVDDAEPFTNAKGNITSRRHTAASVPWSPPAWPTIGAAGLDQRTPDIANVVQEILNRPAWVEGNSMVILIDGRGQRAAQSFDKNPNAAARLYIAYTADDGLPPEDETPPPSQPQEPITETDPSPTQTAPLPTENVYYVDLNGIGGPSSDSNPGTIDKPWKTVLKGFTSAKPGDTVLFREGIYRQTKPITGSHFSHDATAAKRITFRGYPGETAVITSLKLRNRTSYWKHEGGQVYSTPLTPQTSSTPAWARVPHASQGGVPLKLMTFRNADGTASDLTGPGQWVRNLKTWKLYVWARGGGNPGQYLTEFTEFPTGGVNTISLEESSNDDDEADYITFQDLTIEGAYYPISIVTDYVHLIGNTFRNCYGDAIKVIGHQNNHYNSTHGLIEGNDLYHFGEQGIDITGGDHWIIRNNKIHDNASNRGDSSGGTKANGIIVKNRAEHVLVENNDIYNIRSLFGAITVGGSGARNEQLAKEAVHAMVRNNRIYNITGPYAVLVQGAHDSEFSNNIIENSSFSEAIFRVRATHDMPIQKNRNNRITDNHFYNNRVSSGHQIVFYQDSFEGLVIDGNALDPEKTYRYLDRKTKTLEQFQALGFERNYQISSESQL